LSDARPDRPSAGAGVGADLDAGTAAPSAAHTPGTAGLSGAGTPQELTGLRILVLDNYDSFTYNLVQYLGEISTAEIMVHRNDRISIERIRGLEPSHVVISPGPCTPNEAGVSLEVVAELSGDIPILGVCLGHQSIGQAFGGRVTRGTAPVHGKTSSIHHDGRTIFAGLPEPFTATRYHSLVVLDLPPVLELSAWTDDDVVMGIRHREFVVEGVQFHPESILTDPGRDLLRNFLRLRGGRWPQTSNTASSQASG
jgi:anthranilate synthase/aminodeoxychorismate synthase-like glutamine amidotransferase